MKRIKLTQYKYAIVDDEDFELISKYKWYLDISNGYVKSSVEKIYLHRLVMNTPKGIQTDHINRNKLDNRKSNLRICTLQQNRSNSKLYKNNKSGLRGVFFRANRWEARITTNGNVLYLGRFKDKFDAHNVYNIAAKKYHGRFATKVNL